METVTLYTAPGCADCTAAARSMDKKGIPFRPVDVATDLAALDYVRGLGHQRVPMTVVTDEDGAVLDYWSGYRPDKLMALSRVPIS